MYSMIFTTSQHMYLLPASCTSVIDKYVKLLPICQIQKVIKSQYKSKSVLSRTCAARSSIVPIDILVWVCVRSGSFPLYCATCTQLLSLCIQLRAILRIQMLYMYQPGTRADMAKSNQKCVIATHWQWICKYIGQYCFFISALTSAGERPSIVRSSLFNN